MTSYAVDAGVWQGLDFFFRGQPLVEKDVFFELSIDADITRHSNLYPPTSLRKYAQFFEVGAERTNRPDFGLITGSITRPNYAGIPGHLLISAESLEDGLRAFIHTFKLFVDGAEFFLEANNEVAQFAWAFTDEGLFNNHPFRDHAMQFMANMIRGQLTRSWRPEIAVFAGDPVMPIEVYRKALGAPVMFNCGRNELVFPAKLLRRTGNGANMCLFRLLQQIAENELNNRFGAQLELARLKSLIKATIPSGNVTIDKVADALGMRTGELRCAIKNNGASGFRSIVSECRMELAVCLLTKSRTPVSEVSQLLGYSEPAGFIRAFKREFGNSPSAYRKCHNATPSVGEKKDNKF